LSAPAHRRLLCTSSTACAANQTKSAAH
jgi:hypothetical protein